MQGVSFGEYFAVGIEDNVKLQMGKSVLEKQQSKGARAARILNSVAAVAGRLSHRQDFPI